MNSGPIEQAFSMLLNAKWLIQEATSLKALTENMSEYELSCFVALRTLCDNTVVAYDELVSDSMEMADDV